MASRSARLTEGPVGRHLVNMTMPMLIGITTLMAQSFIDAYFLGIVGDQALAAFSFGCPILLIVTSVAIGLGAGTSSVIARAIGADDHERARRLSTDSLILCLVIAGACMIIGIVSCTRGYYTTGGAVGVGRSTTSAVVVASVAILVSNFFIAVLVV